MVQRTQKFLFSAENPHRYRRCQNIATFCPSPTDIFCLIGSFIFIFVPRALSSNLRCRRNILFCEFCLCFGHALCWSHDSSRSVARGGNYLESYSVIVSPMRTWLPLFAHFVCLSPSLSSLGSVEQSLLFPKPGHRPEGLKSLKSVTGCLHFTACSLFHTVAVARFVASFQAHDTE